jgi:hypothetical protein
MGRQVTRTIKPIAIAAIAGAVFAHGVAVSRAAPVTAHQIAACEKRGGSAENHITICTAVIDGTRSAKTKARARISKAAALEERGDALKAKGDIDGALRDYTEALTLDM